MKKIIVTSCPVKEKRGNRVNSLASSIDLSVAAKLFDNRETKKGKVIHVNL